MTIERRYNKLIYNADCIKASIYRFNKIVSVKIDSDESDYICDFVGLDNGFNFDEFIVRFDQELIDQELRKSISQRTDHYRNFILGLAFANTGLQSDDQI